MENDFPKAQWQQLQRQKSWEGMGVIPREEAWPGMRPGSSSSHSWLYQCSEVSAAKSAQFYGNHTCSLLHVGLTMSGSLGGLCCLSICPLLSLCGTAETRCLPSCIPGSMKASSSMTLPPRGLLGHLPERSAGPLTSSRERHHMAHLNPV